jgi:hypothetical protein
MPVVASAAHGAAAGSSACLRSAGRRQTRKVIAVREAELTVMVPMYISTASGSGGKLPTTWVANGSSTIVRIHSRLSSRNGVS